MNLSSRNFDYQQLVSKLVVLNKKVTCAESCTGGLLSKILTDFDGSSSWFDRGFIVYSNQSKVDLLGVKKSTIDKFGAVSEQTVLEMASGALNNSKADIGIAISGIAGPEGGTPEKPVGTVYIGWASSDFHDSDRKNFKGGRHLVRERSVEAALLGLYARL